MELNGDVLATFLSSFGGVEDSTLMASASGTAYGDYVFTMVLNGGGFHVIPHTITYKDTTMMVVVEGRRPLCWSCKQLGHFERSCHQKATTTATKTNDTTTTTTTTTKKIAAEATTVVINANPEIGDNPNKEERWPRLPVKE